MVIVTKYVLIYANGRIEFMSSSERDAYIAEHDITNFTTETIEEEIIDELAELKIAQKDLIKEQYYTVMTNGGNGCTTRVIKNDVPVVVDCRRGGENNDLQNFRELKDYMVRKNKDTETVRDFYNNYLLLTFAEIDMIVEDLVDYGFWLLGMKWYKESLITAAKTEEEVKIITLI